MERKKTLLTFRFCPYQREMYEEVQFISAEDAKDSDFQEFEWLHQRMSPPPSPVYVTSLNQKTLVDLICNEEDLFKDDS